MYETPRNQRRPPSLAPPQVGMPSSPNLTSPRVPQLASPRAPPLRPPVASFSPVTSRSTSPLGSPVQQTPQTPRPRLRQPRSMQVMSSARTGLRTPRPLSVAEPLAPTYRGRIHVGVRVKPSEQGLLPQWLVDAKTHTIDHENAGTFRYDHVYDGVADNETVFANSVLPLLQQVVDGFNATVFAYGTTGSGKTHTMQGVPHDIGVIPRSVGELFRLLPTDAEVSLSYLEIYNEGVFDLLSDSAQREVKIRETTSGLVNGAVETRIVGQRSVSVTDVDELLEWISVGDARRSTHSTQHNAHSSRSHAVVRIEVKINGRASILYLCDLAGSERALQDAERRREGSYINKSLLTLGTIISILSQGGGGHCPYRESKLTRLLQPSLSGAALVVVLCTAQLSASASQAETLNTLRFASRAKNIPVVVRRSFIEESPGSQQQHFQRIAEQRLLELESTRRELDKVRIERDDLQDKLLLLSETPSIDQSLEELTGISFNTNNEVNEELRAENSTLCERVKELEQQNRHLLEEFKALNEAVATMETDSVTSRELRERLRDQELVIQTLLTLKESKEKFDARLEIPGNATPPDLSFQDLRI